jgi:hypothetical protein
MAWGSKSEPMMLWESWLPRPNRRDGPLECSRRFRLERPLKIFGATVEAALDEARRCVAEGGARLHDFPVAELRLSGVEASFDEHGNVAGGLGNLRFEGELRDVPPFPFAFDGPSETFYAAMREATGAVNGLPFVVDEIQETAAYWVFPTLQNGSFGAFIDRRAGRAVAMGSAFPIELWIWGYERGLVGHEEAGDLVVTQVHDRDRAVYVLRRVARGFKSRDLANLPLILRGVATWTAVPLLHEAGGALEWQVDRKS